MRHHRWVLWAFLVVPTIVGITGADLPPQPRATWEEPDSRLAAFSPDGRALVTYSREGSRLRDAGTGQIRAALTTNGVVLEGSVFSADGRLFFAEVYSDKFNPVSVRDLKVWDVASGEPLASFDHVAEGLGDGHFTLSKDGSTFAFLDNSERRPMQVKVLKLTTSHGAFDRAFNMNPGLPRVRIWDVARWRETAVVDGGLPLALSPDGKTLVTGDRDGKAPGGKVWDAATGRLLVKLADRAPGVWPLAISPDDKFVASGGYPDRSLWEIADGRKWTLAAKRVGSNPPTFSPDGRLLFPDGLPSRVWSHIGPNRLGPPCYDLSTLPPRRLELGAGELIVSPDARRCAALQGRGEGNAPCTIVLHDLPNLQESGRFTVDRLIDAGFSPDGRSMALLVGRNERILPHYVFRTIQEIRLVDLVTHRVFATIPTPDPIWGPPNWTFSPDGKTLLISYIKGDNTGPDVDQRPRTVELWDVPRTESSVLPAKPPIPLPGAPGRGR